MAGRIGKGALIVLLGCLALPGCATTDDPRQGGLFGYNPKAYEKRAAERKAALTALEQEKRQEEEKRAALEKAAAAKRSEKESLSRQLSGLDKDIAGLEKSVREAKIGTAAQEKQRREMLAQIEALKTKAAKAQAFSGGEEAKQKEVDRLKSELDRLLKEAETLSKM